MDFCINKIILWPKNEAASPMVIVFKPDKINIITGESHKGKSSLIHIIDYSLGSSKCTIPVGIIRKTTKWFGVEIKADKENLIIARKEPGDQSQTSEMFILEGVEFNQEIVPEGNSNRKDVINRLNQLCGFSSTDFTSEQETGILTQRASFRDTSAFLYQPQHIVANPFTLFFKADTFEHQEKLRTIFPLVLGVINNNLLLLRKKVEVLENEIKSKKSFLTQKQRAKNNWLNEISNLYTKAGSLGLLEENEQKDAVELGLDDFIKYLNDVLLRNEKQLIPEYATGTVESNSKKLNSLISYESELSSEILTLEIQLQKILRFIDIQKNSRRSINLKKRKLEPVGWLQEKTKNDICPFCGSETEKAVEHINLLHEKLIEFSDLSENIDSVNLNLENEINTIEQDIKRLEDEKSQIRSSILELTEKNEEQKRRVSDIRETNRFLGRLEQSIQNYNSVDSGGDLINEIKELESQLDILYNKIDKKAERSRQDAIINKIGNLIIHYASFLDIDEPNNPVKLDFKNLTLRITSEDSRNNFLWEIGSGANWMGYHIATLLSLQEHFLSLKENHIPSFLFIDQPTQVYFPQKWPDEKDLESSNLLNDHSDFYQAQKIFKALSEGIKRTKGNLQIILTDHAPKITWDGIDNIHLVDEWIGDKALIPTDWIELNN